jgi:uncharacterized protein
MTASTPEFRTAILARLVSNAPGQELGRTAVMKLLYFLQELKAVPLGYDFRLYSYGPFDSDVLSDLATAASQGIVKEDTVIYPKGYGYKIAPTTRANQMSEDLVSQNSELTVKVDEILASFGSLSAANLELLSTILYVDREFSQSGSLSSKTAITERVREIKPHFTESTIQLRVNEFQSKGWLKSI